MRWALEVGVISFGPNDRELRAPIFVYEFFRCSRHFIYLTLVLVPQRSSKAALWPTLSPPVVRCTIQRSIDSNYDPLRSLGPLIEISIRWSD